MYLQAALRQFQGVLADHQHQEDQDDPEDPYTENDTTWVHEHWLKRVSILLNLCVGPIKCILTLSPESPGLPGGPEEPGGPGRPYFKQKLSFFVHKKNPTCHNCVLSVLSQSGHTWEKGMHETIWDSLFAAINLYRGILFVHRTTLEWGWVSRATMKNSG